MNETLYAMAMTKLRGLGLQSVLQLYRHYGSATEVVAHRTELTGRAKNSFAYWDEALARAETELQFCDQKKIEVLVLGTEQYPQRLAECPDPPLVLFYRGNANLNKIHTISVVGTRRISEYGKEVCQKFITDLKSLVPDVLVVSGLAYGVDIHAHRACLENSLQTVGVLAHGLDQIYPSMHRNTAEAMLGCGGLLTEYMTMTIPDKGNFVQRNRIVAGMTDATIVIESADKGGALITARLADDYHHDVFAFPGKITDQYSKGCNQLIRDNRAQLITCATDFVDAIGWQPANQPQIPIQRELFPELSPDEEKICEVLRKNEKMGINQIVVACNLPFQDVSSLLFELELKGLVKPLVGGQYRILL